MVHLFGLFRAIAYYKTFCKQIFETKTVTFFFSCQPAPTLVVQSCGMKQKGKLTLRCDDCYFVMRKGRLYVMCKTKPRHKQMAMQKKEKNTWILTHATQSPNRPW